MEMGREGHSGLYTMHFSNLFPPPLETSGASEEKEKKEGETASASAVASASPPPCSVSQFTQWHVLIRMNVENEVCFVKGTGKIFSPTPSLASPMARGIKPNGEPAACVTEPDGIPIVPIPHKDRHCNVFIEGTSLPQQDATKGTISIIGPEARDPNNPTSFRLEVRFDELEAELLGRREPAMLRNVSFFCSGYKGCGWHIGQVTVMVDGELLPMPRPLRFLLKAYFGRRCTNCLDPIYAIGYTCAECEATQYCSRDCLQAHTRKGHGLLCPLLKSNYRARSGYVATEVSDDTALVAWWRCLDNGEYTILVDANNALGYAVEYALCSLKSSKEDGLRYRLLFPTAGAASPANPAGSCDAAGAATTGAVVAAASPPLPTEEEVIDFTCVLLREVNRSAVHEGCVPLASACLSYLYHFSSSTEITIQSHALFFTAFSCEGLDGPITTVEEYVAYARPLHALATMQTEYALKAPISYEFWHRIKFAKDVAIALVNLNSSKPCELLTDMNGIVATQRTESLLLLAKILVMMATRAPEDECRRWLEQAERTLRQCGEEEEGGGDVRAQAIILFRLSALLLLYRDPAKDKDAAALRALGAEKLRQLEEEGPQDDGEGPQADSDAERNGETATTLSQQQSGAEESEVKALEGRT